MMWLCILSLALTVLGCQAFQCPVPPSLWCSSFEIAKSCQVIPHCMRTEWRHRQGNAPLVNFTLYYESLCPDCRQFIVDQLFPAFQSIGGIFNLSLVPYGNARERKVGDSWSFECQHGRQECAENIVDTCTINLMNNIQKSFPFIHCIESGPERSEQAFRECARKFPSIPADKIKACTKNAQGNEWQHEMAVRTDALKPAHTYVPWVTLNGVHNDAIQNKAQRDLVGLLCDAYTGPKPSGCKSKTLGNCPKEYFFIEDDNSNVYVKRMDQFLDY